MTDPRGPREGLYRVIRSYAFFNKAYTLTASNRAMFVPDRSMMQFGFRVVLEFDAKKFSPAATLELALRLKPKDPELLVRQARSLAARGKCDEAFIYYTRFLEINPDNKWIWRERAFLDARRGQWSKGAATYAEMLKGRPSILTVDPFHQTMDPFHHMATCDYAFFLLLAGDHERYRQVCAGLLSRVERSDHTPDPTTAFQIARICALSPGAAIDPVRVVRQAKLSVASHPTLPYCLHALGLAHYRAGQFDKARRRLDESLKDVPHWPSQPTNWVVLAMVHHRLGNAAEARRYLDRFHNWMDQSANAVPYLWGGFPLHPHDWMECLILRREADALLGPPPVKK